jgi:hypothetical protein
VSWTSPSDLKQQLKRCWDRGEILAAQLTGEPLFPLALRLTHLPTENAYINYKSIFKS